MNPKELLTLCQELKIADLRHADEEYAEAVIYMQDLPLWQQKLDHMLGQALKPAGRKPDAGHDALANSHGGVKKDQILYHKKFEQNGLVALLWPWQDKIKITMKIYLA
jgi:hypothetical protein